MEDNVIELDKKTYIDNLKKHSRKKAYTMIRNGINIKTISICTGLSEEEVKIIKHERYVD